MLEFAEPVFEVIHFVDVIATSDCGCDFGFGPMGDDEICTNVGVGGDLQCIQTGEQGNC